MKMFIDVIVLIFITSLFSCVAVVSGLSGSASLVLARSAFA